MKKVFKLLVLAFFTASVTTFFGCKKDTESPINRIPTLTTTDISGITKNSVVTGGNITYNGSDEITERGVCWSRDLYPTLEDAKTTDGAGSGSFTSNLTDLNTRTTYFARAYAITGAGVFYGNQLSFTTQETGDFPGGVQYSGAAGFSIGTKVYLGLGYYDGLPVKDFWEWDKTTNVWTRKADYPGNSAGVAVSFSIGTKGYIGFGNDLIDGATNDFWEYDPSTNSWTKKASIPPSRGMAVGFSIGTRGYIGTGNKDPYSAGAYPDRNFQDFWEYDQATNTWTQKANFGGIARSGAVGFSIGNKGYIGTGTVDGKALFSDFWEWDQATNVWTKKADFGGIARYGAVGFSIGNKGYIGTGTGDDNSLFNDFWEWDQATNIWTKKADFGGSSRFGAVGFSIGNNGYIGTGANGWFMENAFRDFWGWDQATNVWTKKTDFGGVVR